MRAVIRSGERLACRGGGILPPGKNAQNFPPLKTFQSSSFYSLFHPPGETPRLPGRRDARRYGRRISVFVGLKTRTLFEIKACDS
jgi:hypothetical protein